METASSPPKSWSGFPASPITKKTLDVRSSVDNVNVNNLASVGEVITPTPKQSSTSRETEFYSLFQLNSEKLMVMVCRI